MTFVYEMSLFGGEIYDDRTPSATAGRGTNKTLAFKSVEACRNTVRRRVSEAHGITLANKRL